MTLFFNGIYYLIEIGGALAFLQVLNSFIPKRAHWPMKILAIFCCCLISATVIYAEDFINIIGVFAGLFVYMAVFHKGELIPKLSIAFIIYPLLISLNYLTQDIGMRVYFMLPVQNQLTTDITHSVSLLIRPLFWLAVWQMSKRRAQNLSALLDTKMWWLLNSICLAVIVGLLMVLLAIPENLMITYSVALACIITILGILYLIGYIANSVLTASRLHDLQKEYQYYEEKLKDEERVRTIYHDMKNHLLLLQSDYGREGSTEVQQLIESVQEQISGYENYYHTGNTFLDVILRDKAARAKRYGIDFSAMIHFDDGESMAPLDISTIFGNALDNAIEANLKLPVSERMITVKAERVRDMLSILVENQTAETAAARLETQKSDKLLHGLGLSSIKYAVDKYDGQCVVTPQKSCFTLKIIIPIPAS